MVFLYDLGIRIYLALIYLLSPFNGKARAWLKGRRGWRSALGNAIHFTDQTVWFHCSSLGEFEQGRPVIEAFREKYPSHKILVTFFSPSGYQIRKGYKGADHVFYLPIDTYNNARYFLQTVKPVAVFFIKYEFWFHFLNQLKRGSIPTFIISATFRKEQLFFRPYGKWYRKFLGFFDHLFVQNQSSDLLLRSIGITNVTVTGDTRFDRVMATASAAKSFPILEQFAQDAKVIVAGSTWPKDEEILVDFFNRNNLGFKLIIAPHEINPKKIETLAGRFKANTMILSNPIFTPTDTRVIIIDTIGILSSVYRYGTFAYIGGGFGTGIHNILEAAAFGLPVVFGPNYHKFNEAVEMVSLGLAFPVHSPGDFHDVAHKLNVKSRLLADINKSTLGYIAKAQGATTKIMSHFNECFGEKNH